MTEFSIKCALIVVISELKKPHEIGRLEQECLSTTKSKHCNTVKRFLSF